jgi:sigma-E factor negative regulatory protein RseC
MIEQLGRVVAVDNKHVWVELHQDAHCGGCGVRDGCGQNLLQKMASGKLERMELRKTCEVNAGDWVTVGIDGAAVFNASLLVYGLPLVALVIGGASARLLGLSDVAVLFIALLGLAGAGLLVKTLSSRLACNPRYHPQLLRVSDAPD